MDTRYSSALTWRMLISPDFPPTGQGCPMKRAMEGDTLDRKLSVLIVDRSEETREVLQTALSRRGMHTFTAKHASDGVELTRQHHPDLIVLDLESDNVNMDRQTPPFWAGQKGETVPVILLGSLRRNQPQIPGSEFVSKPYHYGPLIRRIEELLKSEV
jgi:DNA-binding response OmpR family regulator